MAVSELLAALAATGLPVAAREIRNPPTALPRISPPKAAVMATPRRSPSRRRRGSDDGTSSSGSGHASSGGSGHAASSQRDVVSGDGSAPSGVGSSSLITISQLMA